MDPDRDQALAPDADPRDEGGSSSPLNDSRVQDASTEPLHVPTGPPQETANVPQVDDFVARRTALLDKIALAERRGAILPADAHTLRFQVHDSTSGRWRAVEERLAQLAFSWNPYQDYSAADRRAQEATTTTATAAVGTGAKSNDAKEKEQPTTCSANSPVTSPMKPRARPKPKKKRDYYELLELPSRAATAEEIKRQFRKLALRLHPDKRQQATASAGSREDGAAAVETVEALAGEAGADATEFARLRVAYETLSDPEQRAAYDLRLVESERDGTREAAVEGILVRDQIQLEASTDFASLEWMARVKHKMDVMDRIAVWAKLLGIRATDIRFETGEPCVGRGCGKIVSMDRDLACYGSPRRRVYVCMLHKYIHACDGVCTSHVGDAELDKKVCQLRAYWLIQNWLFDALQRMAAEAVPLEETKDCEDVSSPSSPFELVPAEIHLGDDLTTFSLSHMQDCGRGSCRQRFQFLEKGIYVCRRHGTPHICTYEQCDRKELRQGHYVCWVSGSVYGFKTEDVGTGTRTRTVVYTDQNGEANSIQMDVPAMLPLGQMTSYLIDDGGETPRSDRNSSLSPPPPANKRWREASANESPAPRQATTVASYKRAREEELSPTRARIRRRLAERIQQTDASFYVYLRVPPAVANLPKIALELQELVLHNEADERQAECPGNDILPIRVRPQHTLNYIKYWMEGLTEHQISLWDQQIYWGDTLVGDETKVMTLEEHGIKEGCQLELRLHDDCPLLLGNWTGKQTLAGEYNTVQISKEAEEDLDEEQEELDKINVAEEAFEEDNLIRQRRVMELRGELNRTEVIEYNGDAPRLVGIIRDQPNDRKQLTTGSHCDSRPISVVELESKRAVDNHEQSLRSLASTALPVKRSKKMRS